MKTGVITLAMRRDFPHALVAIASLESQLDSAVHHFVLLNDQHDPEIAARIEGHPHRSYSCSGTNLGVAAGRNDLISSALDWGADRIVVFDDDLLAPRDYLDRLLAAHRRLEEKDSRTAIVAPAVINFGYARSAMLGGREQRALAELRSTRFGTTKTWQRRLSRSGEVPLPGQIEHLGIVDWETHYLSVGRRAAARWLASRGRIGTASSAQVTVVANMDWARRATANIGGDPIRVDTLPGGVWCLSASALAEVGQIDEAFTPFGFEDAEWCIRATKLGFHNYLATDVLVAHDLQERLATRDPVRVMASRGRARGLLIAKHAVPERRIAASLHALAEVFDVRTMPPPQRGAAAAAFLRNLLPALSDLGIPSPGSTSSAAANGFPSRAPTIGVDLVIDDSTVGIKRFEVNWPEEGGFSITGNLSAEAPFWGQLEVAIDGPASVRTLARTVFGIDDNLTQYLEDMAGDGAGWQQDLIKAVHHILVSDCRSQITVSASLTEVSASVDVGHGCTEPGVTA